MLFTENPDTEMENSAFNLKAENPVAGVACSHAGCLSHRSHPCDGCGRVAGLPLSDPRAVVVFVGSHRIRFADETDLQDRLAELFERAGILFRREFDLKPWGRVDFFLPEGAIALEVKIKGSPSDVVRQVHGYARHAAVKSLVLVTARRQLANVLPLTLNHKPCRVAALWSL